MFPHFWGVPPLTDFVLQQFQNELERMRKRFDAAFNLLLSANPYEVGRTPAEIVYAERRLRLLRYRPTVEAPLATPLLIVPSPLNRSYILDLTPGRSIVEFLVERGLDVYLVEWNVMSREDRAVPFDTYVTGYLQRVVEEIRARSGQDRVSLLGYSMGGTFTTIFTALERHLVRNLVTMAAPINFHDDGLLSQWTRKELFNVDLVVDTLGSMPLELLQASFSMLKPTAQIAQRMALAEQLGDMHAVQDFMVMQSWMDDNVQFIGEAYRKWVKEFYQENYLVQGKLVIDGRRVQLELIDAPLLVVTAAKDCICPPQSAAVLVDMVSSTDRQVLSVPTGHIGLVAGHSAPERYWPALAEWLAARSTAPGAPAPREQVLDPAPLQRRNGSARPPRRSRRKPDEQLEP